MKKVLFTATVDVHILSFHIPYLKLFKENGYEVHVATNGNKEIPFTDVKHIVPFERNPFKLNNIKAIFKLKKIIDKEKYDIIHTHTPMGSVVTRIAAINTRKKNKTKVIYTAHGFHFCRGENYINWILFYPVEKILSKYTDVLITINKEDYELASKKFKTRYVEYIPGIGVDETRFNFEMEGKEKLKLRNEIGCNKDSFIMICIAELSKRKNQKMLLGIMKKLAVMNHNVHLLLVGEGNMEKYYKKIVIKNNLENNVHFLGYREDIPKLLKISDLLVSTSKREGLPVNLIEAMCCNLPIIATNCRGNRDLICAEYLANSETMMIEKILNMINAKKEINYCMDKYKLSDVINKYKGIYNLL